MKNLPIAQQNIIEILRIEALPDEQKIKIVEEATELLQKRLLVRVFDMLGEEKKQGFTDILDSGDELSLSNFISHNVPDFQGLVIEELGRIKQEMAGLAKAS